MPQMLSRLALLAAAVVALLPGTTRAGALRNGTATNPVRIMPFGDDMTYGCGENSYASAPAFKFECCVYDGGYRSWLGSYLAGMMNAPIRSVAIPPKNVTFVGSQSSGPGAIRCDHEGHPGARVADLSALVPRLTADAEIVLLTAGTVDIVHNASASAVASDLAALLRALHARYPTALVFVASVTRIHATPAWDAVVQQYNRMIPGVVAAAAAAGQDAVFADIGRLSNLCSPAGNDCTNNAGHAETNHVFPTVSGYTIMGAAWYQVLFPHVCGNACGPSATCRTASCGGDPTANLPGIPSNDANFQPLPKPIPGAQLGWIGNTYGGGCASGPCHVQPGLSAMHVGRDSTIYTIASYDENVGQAQIYSEDGKVVGDPDLKNAFRACQRCFVAPGTKYLFYTATQNGFEYSSDPVLGTAINMSGIARYNNTAGPFPTGFSPAPWPSGEYIDKAFLKTGSLLESDQLSGLAVCTSTSGSEVLLASHTLSSALFLIDPETMTITSTATVHGAGSMVCGPPGFVFMLLNTTAASNGSTAQVVKLSFDGKVQATFPAFVGMGNSIAYDNDSRTLLVIDTVQEQVVFLDAATGRETGRFGGAGGIFAGPDPGANDPFRFDSLKAVGVDAVGCVYTASDSHLILRKHCCSGSEHARPTRPAEWAPFAKALKLEWEISNLLFMEVADVGRANSSRAYLFDRVMGVDWSHNPTSDNFWTYEGKTTNPSVWPWDPRVGRDDNTAWVRSLPYANGTKADVLFTTPAGQPLGVFRTNGPGTTTPPCAVFSSTSPKLPPMPGAPEKGAWLWQDTNGDSQPTPDEYLEFPGLAFTLYTMVHVDEDGGIWWRVVDSGVQNRSKQRELLYFRAHGLNKHGCPVYTNVTDGNWTLPLRPFAFPEDDANGAVTYDVVTDTLWMADYTDEFPLRAPDWEWGTAGSTFCRYDAWSKQNDANKTPSFCFHMPYRHNSSFPSPKGTPVIPEGGVQPTWQNQTHSMTTFRNCVFVSYLAEVVTFVLRGTDGSLIGALDPKAHPEIGSQSGWFDMMHATNVVELPDGRIAMLAEEDALNKVVVWLLPKGTCDALRSY